MPRTSPTTPEGPLGLGSAQNRTKKDRKPEGPHSSPSVEAPPSPSGSGIMPDLWDGRLAWKRKGDSIVTALRGLKMSDLT